MDRPGRMQGAERPDGAERDGGGGRECSGRTTKKKKKKIDKTIWGSYWHMERVKTREWD